MKVSITTTPRAIEISNFLISSAIDSIQDKPELMKAWSINKKDLEHADRFRKKLIKSFLEGS